MRCEINIWASELVLFLLFLACSVNLPGFPSPLSLSCTPECKAYILLCRQLQWPPHRPLSSAWPSTIPSAQSSQSEFLKMQIKSYNFPAWGHSEPSSFYQVKDQHCKEAYVAFRIWPSLQSSGSPSCPLLPPAPQQGISHTCHLLLVKCARLPPILDLSLCCSFPDAFPTLSFPLVSRHCSAFSLNIMTPGGISSLCLSLSWHPIYFRIVPIQLYNCMLVLLLVYQFL